MYYIRGILKCLTAEVVHFITPDNLIIESRFGLRKLDHSFGAKTEVKENPRGVLGIAS